MDVVECKDGGSLVREMEEEGEEDGDIYSRGREVERYRCSSTSL
jgi:hypothetical protein